MEICLPESSGASLKATRIRRWAPHSFSFPDFPTLRYTSHIWKRLIMKKDGQQITKVPPPTYWFYLKRILRVCKILIKGVAPSTGPPMTSDLLFSLDQVTSGFLFTCLSILAALIASAGCAFWYSWVLNHKCRLHAIIDVCQMQTSQVTDAPPPGWNTVIIFGQMESAAWSARLWDAPDENRILETAYLNKM